MHLPSSLLLPLLVVLFVYRSDGAVSHTFDFNSAMPRNLAVMYSMSWFGLQTNDPQGGGPDSAYGNWNVGKQGSCVYSGAPSQCSLGSFATSQRNISSYFRPLAGIYSSSGKDAESQARIDLFLSTLRRPCDTGARLDVWAVQMATISRSSKYLANPSFNVETPYQAYLHFLSRAERAGMTGVIMPGYDSTWVYHFGSAVGLGKCDDSAGNARVTCLNATANDIVDMTQISAASSASFLVNGKPVILMYTATGGLLPNITEWQWIVDTARSRLSIDFYLIGTVADYTHLQVFDAEAPWLAEDVWEAKSSISPLYNRTMAWLNQRYAGLFNKIASYPGRAILGGVTPGFQDFTQDWGNCRTRVIPRDPIVLQAQFDWLKQHNMKNMFFWTWDDYTEGSIIEPDVVNGTAVLLHIRQLLGDLNGEAADAGADQRLVDRWHSYPVLRNCSGQHVTSIPVVDLTCPSGAPTPNVPGTSGSPSSPPSTTAPSATTPSTSSTPSASTSSASHVASVDWHVLQGVGLYLFYLIAVVK